MYRVTALWSGFPGAPGYSNFYFSQALTGAVGAQGAANRVWDFFNSMTLCFPSSARIQVEPNVAGVDAETGQQEDDYVIGTPKALISGAGAGTYAGPSGACVTWRTGSFLSGRRVRGRTFLVPLASSAYQEDGTLAAARIAEIRTGAAALANDTLFEGAGLVVWHRPTNGAGGSEHRVVGSQVADKVAVLRSRRG